MKIVVYLKEKSMTKEEKNERQRKYRQLNNNACTKKYEKTKSGFIMRTYRNMKSRCNGIQYKKAHLYMGKELLDKESFYDWAITELRFNYLFEEWEKSGYQRRLTPSIDRIDANLGYTLENMRWLTHSENSSLANRKRSKVC